MNKTKRSKRRLVIPAREMWAELYRNYERHLRAAGLDADERGARRLGIGAE